MFRGEGRLSQRNVWARGLKACWNGVMLPRQEARVGALKARTAAAVCSSCAPAASAPPRRHAVPAGQLRAQGDPRGGCAVLGHAGVPAVINRTTPRGRLLLTASSLGGRRP